MRIARIRRLRSVIILVVAGVAQTAWTAQAQTGPREVSITEIKNNAKEYQKKLVSIEGTVQTASGSQLYYTLQDDTGASIDVYPHDALPAAGAKGKAIGAVLVSQPPVFLQALWFSNGETPPDLFPLMLEKLELSDKRDEYTTVCDEYVLAVPGKSDSTPRAYVARVVVIGPRQVQTANAEWTLGIGVFPQGWDQMTPQWKQQGKVPFVDFRTLRVTLVYPDDAVGVEDGPSGQLYRQDVLGPDPQPEWADLQPVDVLSEDMMRLIESIVDLGFTVVMEFVPVPGIRTADKLVRVLPHIAYHGAKLGLWYAEKQEELPDLAVPLEGYDLREFANDFDALTVPPEQLERSIAVALKVSLHSLEAEWPLPWVRVEGQAEFHRSLPPGTCFNDIDATLALQGLDVPSLTINGFMKALKASDWLRALTYILVDPTQDQDAVTGKWVKTLSAAFERADVIGWRTVALNEQATDTFTADVEFTVQGNRTGDTAKNRMTLELVRSDGEWKIKSIKSE